ncbi:MAG: cytochrome C [Phycisphaerae bacterium]|nr:cytochrome C [Phycisphaerae bacterium]
MNALPTLGALVGGPAVVVVVAGGWYWLTPDYFEVGYQPVQPGGGYNHQLHAGELGIDCRYCHTHVEESDHANIPSVATCMGCHTEGKLRASVSGGPGGDRHNRMVSFIRDAYAQDESIEWSKIHLVPDYAHFPHHVHVNAGVSCYSCHGQIAGMPVVYQAEGLGMGWCLDCHRNPEERLVPPDKVTDLVWVEHNWFDKPTSEREHNGVTPEDLVASLRRDPPQNCGACHY